MSAIVIEDLEQLQLWARENKNHRLLGLINRLKYADSLDEQILALASIIRALRKHRLKYSEHFVRHCLLYLFEECG